MKKYDFAKIEKKWQSAWKRKKVYEPDLKKARKPFYNLMMFPYPSAEGLHVGNMYAFTGSDVYGRFMRMQGHDVFEPIGLDGFGIHSENYAMKIGAHPMKLSKVSEKRFYKQLEMLGNGFAWNERLETYAPEYYRWTQWVFVQMWKRGLAYRKKQPVNWCTGCKTVLADEQVENDKCERCSSAVEQRELDQWFFKITDYADRLLGGLDGIDWSERVKTAQRNWIGKSEGASVNFQIADHPLSVEVFTTRPETLYGATYAVLAPEHPLVAKLAEHAGNKADVAAYVAAARKKTNEERMIGARDKTGVPLQGVSAVNPATGAKIPVFVADYVLGGYGTGAVMAVPAHDKRDFAFAKKFGLPVKIVVRGPGVKLGEPLEEAYEGDGVLENSGDFTGKDSRGAVWDIVKAAEGERKTQFRLRDWLVSRQRYWGAPIPMIFCEHCAFAGAGERSGMPGWFAVPEKELPVKLPYVKEFRPEGTGESPLAGVKSFYAARCPRCGKKARRETDVSDTFLDSAWYYFRYPDAKNKRAPWDAKTAEKWLPVDMYIGGAEHSVLHLLYSRFVSMALSDMGFAKFEEPFAKFRAHGLLIKDGAKMSKSKGNVVNPDEYVKKYGADTLRTYLMFLAPFEQGGDFRDAGIVGVARFLERVWRMGQAVAERPRGAEKSAGCEKALHKAIKKVTEDVANLQYNTAISALMVFMNEAEAAGASKKEFETFLKLLAPFAPHVAEELWETLGGKGSVHAAKWPEFDPAKIAEENADIVVQVNGKLRAKIAVPRGADEKTVVALALAEKTVADAIAGNPVRRTVFVADKLVNFVA